MTGECFVTSLLSDHLMHRFCEGMRCELNAANLPDPIANPPGGSEWHMEVARGKRLIHLAREGLP